MNEKARLARAHGLAGELDMGAVQRVAGLERDDTPPAELAEAFAQRGRAVAQRAVIVVRNRTQAEHAPARIDRMRAAQQVGDAGVGVVDGAVDRTGLLDLLGPPRLPDLHDGDRHALAVAKRDRLSGPERGGEGLAHVERHRDRPQRARGEAHGAQHALVLRRAHEPRERGEGAVEHQLQIAELTRGEVPAPRLAHPGPCLAGRGHAEIRLVEHPVP